MVHKVPLFPVRQNRDLVKIHKVNRLYALGSGSCTACFIVKISQKFSILDFIVAIHPIFLSFFVPMIFRPGNGSR